MSGLKKASISIKMPSVGSLQVGSKIQVWNHHLSASECLCIQRGVVAVHRGHLHPLQPREVKVIEVTMAKVTLSTRCPRRGAHVEVSIPY